MTEQDKNLSSYLLNFAGHIAPTTIGLVFNSGASMIEYRGLENLEKLPELMDKYPLPLLIVAMSHMSHSDMLVGIRLVEKIRLIFSQIGRFYMPTAASLSRGLQGLSGSMLYSGILPYLQEHRIVPLPVITANDRNSRHLTPDLKWLEKLSDVMREDNSAVLVFPEGTVEAGRFDCSGQMKGMQRVANPFLPSAVQRAHNAGRKVAVLPVGISGTNRILSADTRFLTFRSAGALISSYLLRRTPRLASATIGEPYEYPNIPEVDLTDREARQEVNNRVMRSIALLKPPEERGCYRFVSSLT